MGSGAEKPMRRLWRMSRFTSLIGADSLGKQIYYSAFIVFDQELNVVSSYTHSLQHVVEKKRNIDPRGKQPCPSPRVPNLLSHPLPGDVVLFGGR